MSHRGQFVEYLEEAGFVDENGNLGRPVPSGTVVVPEEVWLERDVLRWRLGEAPQKREISRNMINQFVRLRDAASILDFAKRWGVLAIGKGDYSFEDRRSKFVSTTLWARRRSPEASKRPVFIVGRPLGKRILRPGREGMREGSEPIAAWQYYARRAHAVLHLAARIKNGDPSFADYWSEVCAQVVRRPTDQELESQLSAVEKHHKYGMGYLFLWTA